MNSLKPAFCISGGDLVMDSLAVDENRANQLYDIYEDCCKRLTAPLYNTIGNHEVFGITVPDLVSRNHPDWGKGLFKRRLGNGATYRSFDHQGAHCVLLDTVGIEAAEDGRTHRYIGQIGLEQLAWLKSDLDGLAPNTPVILVGHIPLFTLYDLIKNGMNTPLGRSSVLTDGGELYSLIAKYRVFGQFEGHIHVNELYQYKGIPFIDTAAVCGAWWAGARDGHPEGFNLVHVYEDGLEAEYVTYGWDAAKYAS